MKPHESLRNYYPLGNMPSGIPADDDLPPDELEVDVELEDEPTDAPDEDPDDGVERAWDRRSDDWVYRADREKRLK